MQVTIGRRELIVAIGGAAAARSMWRPLSVHAQQPTMPVVGFLNTRAPGEDTHLLAAFRQGLSETGYVEGKTVAIEYRWAEGHNDRLPALAADLVRRRVTVIAANSQATIAARAATTTIPIVFITGADPVQVGFVASLSRPGGNLTGVASLDTDLGRKRLQLLHELLPKAGTIAALVNPTFPGSDIQARDLQTAASTLGLRLHVLYASTEHDINTAFAALVRLQANGLVIANDPFFTSWSEQLAALALRHAVPAIYEFRAFVAAGGLMSYGPRIADLYRLVGVYTGRILKGEKPADLPVQQSTSVELIINLKTAKAFGLTVPLPLLGRADEVIE
jgi:putative tryptophan/tyrosine transport system substrate-binding protein